MIIDIAQYSPKVILSSMVSSSSGFLSQYGACVKFVTKQKPKLQNHVNTLVPVSPFSDKDYLVHKLLILLYQQEVFGIN